jgi:hypothetical protein
VTPYQVLISSMTNRSCYIFSTAYFEARYGGASTALGWQGFDQTPEGRLKPRIKMMAEKTRLELRARAWVW